MGLRSIVAYCIYVALSHLFPLAMSDAAAQTDCSPPNSLRFEVRIGHTLTAKTGVSDQPKTSASGRLLVILGNAGGSEPRLSIGQTGKTAAPILGCDVDKLVPDADVILDDRSAIFPASMLSQLRPGPYAIQALLHTNIDLNLANAPGDLYSPVVTAGLTRWLVASSSWN